MKGHKKGTQESKKVSTLPGENCVFYRSRLPRWDRLLRFFSYYFRGNDHNLANKRPVDFFRKTTMSQLSIEMFFYVSFLSVVLA